MRLVWVPRSQWGPTRPYTEEFIAARVSDPATAKTSLQIHHTGAIDAGDVTPNRWTYGRAVDYMRRLEWVRLSDLGPLPYNANPALSEDGETVWLFEGRGILKRGAHTAGYNVSGVGIGVLGNLDRTDTPPEDLATLTEAITEIGRRLRHTEGLTRIGDNRNPKGWEVWGHRDTTTKSCPGALLYPRLADVRFIETVPDPGDIDMDPAVRQFYEELHALITSSGGNSRSLMYVLDEYRARAKSLGVGGNEPQRVADGTLAPKDGGPHTHTATVELV
jgi:hypothetical protein